MVFNLDCWLSQPSKPKVHFAQRHITASNTYLDGSAVLDESCCLLCWERQHDTSAADSGDLTSVTVQFHPDQEWYRLLPGLNISSECILWSTPLPGETAFMQHQSPCDSGELSP